MPWSPNHQAPISPVSDNTAACARANSIDRFGANAAAVAFCTKGTNACTGMVRNATSSIGQ